MLRDEIEVVKIIYGEDNVCHVNNQTSSRGSRPDRSLNLATKQQIKADLTSNDSRTTHANANTEAQAASRHRRRRKGSKYDDLRVKNIQPYHVNLDSWGFTSTELEYLQSGETNADTLFSVIFHFSALKSWPPDCPPTIHVEAHWLSPDEEERLVEKCREKTLEENPDYENFITSFLLHICEEIPLENLRTYLHQVTKALDRKTDSAAKNKQVDHGNFEDDGHKQVTEPVNIDAGTCTKTPSGIVIYHGRNLIDRKSNFQAHFAKVKNLEEVREVTDTMYSNSKVQRATHRMVSYRFESNTSVVANKRIPTETKILHKDHDSDGETGAGSNMQWLVDTMDAKNVYVMVVRWYGGIHLGPDRFRHINALTREVIQEHNS